MSVFRWGLTATISTFMIAAGLSSVKAVEPGAPDRLIDKEFVTLIAVRKELSAPSPSNLSLPEDTIERLKSYYDSDAARLVWVDGEGLKDTAKSGLQSVFERAYRFGLNPQDYDLPETSTSDLVAAEINLSLAALSYAAHAQAGRFEPASIDRKYIDIHPEPPAAKDVLAGMAASAETLPDHLESYHPTHPQFLALKKKLAEIRVASQSGNVPTRIPDGPSLGPDTYHPHIEIVRERLEIVPQNDAGRDNPAQYYDSELEAAVLAFQAENGLQQDGIIGRRTREALNIGTIPVSAETIIANMERWRWTPRELGERYVFVNVPEFKFQVISGEKIIHQERLVTGSPKHKTPIFSDVMETVVFNPYWNVPRSILVNEIIPAERSNPGYVRRNNLEVIWQGREVVDPYFVDWYAVNPNKLFLRQTPGPRNALGRVKFLFPNKHAVYMHDTPAKHLFNRSTRAYSHGCLRVRDPLKFAELLLADQGWSKSRIDRTLQTAYDQHVALEQKLQVHISYFTVWVGDDGDVRGFRDIYNFDRQVKVALNLDGKKRYASNEEQQDFDIGERGLQN